jgi:hypothetical protein
MTFTAVTAKIKLIYNAYSNALLKRESDKEDFKPDNFGFEILPEKNVADEDMTDSYLKFIADMC